MLSQHNAESEQGDTMKRNEGNKMWTMLLMGLIGVVPFSPNLPVGSPIVHCVSCWFILSFLKITKAETKRWTRANDHNHHRFPPRSNLGIDSNFFIRKGWAKVFLSERFSPPLSGRENGKEEELTDYNTRLLRDDHVLMFMWSELIQKYSYGRELVRRSVGWLVGCMNNRLTSLFISDKIFNTCRHHF